MVAMAMGISAIVVKEAPKFINVDIDALIA